MFGFSSHSVVNFEYSSTDVTTNFSASTLFPYYKSKQKFKIQNSHEFL